MAKRYIPINQAWIDQIFTAKAVKDNGVVRRSVADVKKFASPKLLEATVRANKYHLIKTGDQYVVLCHKGELKVIC